MPAFWGRTRSGSRLVSCDAGNGDEAREGVSGERVHLGHHHGHRHEYCTGRRHQRQLAHHYHRCVQMCIFPVDLSFQGATLVLMERLEGLCESQLHNTLL